MEIEPQPQPQVSHGYYFPTEEEKQILIPNLIKFFNSPERSRLRKSIMDETSQTLSSLNPEHWTPKAVRLWFNNNKKHYYGVPQNNQE